MSKRPILVIAVVFAVGVVAGVGVWAVYKDENQVETVAEVKAVVEKEAEQEQVQPGSELVESEQDKSHGAPDQPGWTTKPLASDFDISTIEFVRLRTLTHKAGLPFKKDDRLVIEPFSYAAIEITDDPKNFKDYEVLALELMTALRSQEVFTAANPILTFTADPRVDTTAKWFIGVPVGPGTKVAAPLVLRQFNGGDVEVSKLFSIKEDREKKGEFMTGTAADVGVGRIPGRILYFRFSGWNDWTLEGKGVHAQAIGVDKSMANP